MGCSWHSMVDPIAKKLELGATFNANVQFNPVACAYHANLFREMARIMDRDAKDRGASVIAIRFLGLKFTIARDG